MCEVSVVIPAFNRESTLHRAVSSVLVQTFQDFEIVVVDDASTDGTDRVANGFDDARVRILSHECNRGAAAARNTGIKAARGLYIAFLDSDDEWLPDKLSTQLARLQAASPDTAVSCTGVVIHLLDHGIKREQPLESSDDWLRRLALGCDMSPGSTLLARKEVFDEVGPLDETLSRFEDWDWLLRYAQVGRVCTIRETLAVVYNRRGRLGREYEKSARRFIVKHDALVGSLGKRERAQSFCDLWMQVCGTYAFEAMYLDAMRAAIYAARYRPVHVGRRLAGQLAQRIRGFR
jgi:glycosyltransferase involved in cell wall biosynthesis